MNIVRKLTSWKFAKYLLIVFNTFASISSIVGLIYTLFSPRINDTLSLLWIFGIIVFTMLLIAIILLFNSERNDKLRDTLLYLNGIHSILHQLRDFQQSLKDIHKRDNIIYKYDFIEKITANMIDIMNLISDILSKITNRHVRACIKLNAFTKEMENDPNNIVFMTFARSGNRGIQATLKEQNKTIKLCDNTDYEYIYNIREGYEEERNDIFYKKNLKKYDKKLRKDSNNREFYKNSDKKWKSKYNTTIVLPIRYLKDYNDEEAVYDILGFLCVDSKKSNTFEKGNINAEIEFLKGIADSLYSYLIDSIEFFEKLE